MQIESLKVFCDLAETESFTKAAQINDVTQSAVSQQISSLEKRFKSLLIERSKKKFRLTREGQVLYEYSKQIIQTYDSLHNRLQEIQDINLVGEIKESGWFVEQDQVAILSESHGDPCTLALPPGKGIYWTVGKFFDVGDCQRFERDAFVFG